MDASQTTRGPTRERIATIDIIRGFTIFGILIANMLTFSGPYHQFADAAYWPKIDALTLQITRLLVEGRVLPMLAFLFGLGIAMQYNHHGSGSFTGFMFRRMSVLMLIGWAHYIFLWQADILASYAFLGFLLALTVRRGPRFHVMASISALLLWLAFYAVLWLLIGGEPGTAAAAEDRFRSFSVTNVEEHAQSWLVILQGRLEDFPAYLMTILFDSLLFMPGFFMGMAAGRSRLYENLASHSDRLKRLSLMFIAIGAPCAVMDISFRSISQTQAFSLPTFGWLAVFIVGSLAMALFYLATLARLASRKSWLERLKPMAAVGRLSLSNYLLQSLICTLIFNGYGLGLYNRLGHFRAMLLVPVVFALNLGFSLWWTRRHRFGPVEWLWRRMTYGYRALQSEK